jgi:hypothetical protein
MTSSELRVSEGRTAGEIRRVKNRDIIFRTTLLAVACFILSPVAQAKQSSEGRGNGNSAAEGLTIGRASRVLPKDLKPAEILFRLGSIPTSFRPGSKRK